MRVSRILLIVFGCALVGSSFPATGDPLVPISDPALLSWSKAVRTRVAIAVASIKRAKRGRSVELGRVNVGFTVTTTGEIVAVRVEGAPGTAARAAAALQALGRVPSPPDDRPHAVNVAINFH